MCKAFSGKPLENTLIRTDLEIPEIQVVAGILCCEERFLAVRRPPGKPFAGLWEFPGGKVEPGETHSQALIRELREELGVDVAVPRFWRATSHAYDHLLVHLHFFVVRDFRGAPQALEGHTLAWLTPEEAQTKTFLEADAGIVADLARNGVAILRG